MNQNLKYLLLGVAVLFLLISTYLAVVILIPRFQAASLPPGLSTAQVEAEAGQNTATFFTLIVVMIAGIVCSYIFEAAKKSGPTINVVAEVSKMLSSSRFIMAIVVTPLIFNSVYLAIGLNPQNIGDYLLAFQNGFFWETIMLGLARHNQG